VARDLQLFRLAPVACLAHRGYQLSTPALRGGLVRNTGESLPTRTTY